MWELWQDVLLSIRTKRKKTGVEWLFNITTMTFLSVWVPFFFLHYREFSFDHIFEHFKTARINKQASVKDCFYCHLCFQAFFFSSVQRLIEVKWYLTRSSFLLLSFTRVFSLLTFSDFCFFHSHFSLEEKRQLNTPQGCVHIYLSSIGSQSLFRFV